MEDKSVSQLLEECGVKVPQWVSHQNFIPNNKVLTFEGWASLYGETPIKKLSCDELVCLYINMFRDEKTLKTTKMFISPILSTEIAKKMNEFSTGDQRIALAKYIENLHNLVQHKTFTEEEMPVYMILCNRWMELFEK